jgi:hypothetical protein
MPADKSIFGLRFGSNAGLQPTHEEIRTFLATPKKTGKPELHADDLASYREMLGRVTTFEQGRLQGVLPENFRERMFYGALGVSSFFNPALKSAIELYKYHCHALLALDFKKPAAFIKAAEEEMGRLNPKKNSEAERLGRLQGMVEERKRTLEILVKRRRERAEELQHIARYIGDNLVKIEKLCKGSIVVLVDLQVARREEDRLIAEIKEHFKERLRDALHSGQVTKERLETAKKDVAVLSREMSALLREDVFAMAGLFEAIHDHAWKAADAIGALMKKIGGMKNAGIEDEGKVYARVEQVLASLASECRFELKAAAIRSETAHEDVLREKRSQMLVCFLELLEKERRAWRDRRSGEDRRKFHDPGFKGPERRRKKRRSGKSRRDE